MATSDTTNPAKDSRIILQPIEEEMRKSYLDYAMSVIVGRALPDARDGLKPVHRRILFGMHDLGLQSSKSYKKSARIVGEVLGKYHPHGDSAVYDALVRMAQAFSLRYPLVKGQGNFGSVDGDRAAAMRYTEAKMTKLADEMLVDIDKDTVEFAPNFDGSLEEPLVLPSKIPNLLVNGSAGIAVGMATNIPPHNMTEVCQALMALIEDKDTPLVDLLQHIKGPDFPTGAEILGKNGMLEAYTSGHGIIKVRSIIDEEEKAGKKRLVVTQIPYMVNKANMIEHIASLVKEKRIPEISDLRDESDRKGIRIVIELKKDTNPEVVKNKLFSYSSMQTSFSINLLALVNNEPKLLNLKELLSHFLNHRRTIVRRRTEHDLKRAKEREHILDGLVIALNNIDPIILLIKKASSAQDAKDALMARYRLSDKQSQAVLDMRLQKLAALEQEKIREEQGQIKALISRLTSILDDKKEIDAIIVKELRDVQNSYGDERKTHISDIEEDLDIEDLIKDETVVVTVSNTGYVKRIPLMTYKVQRRGGRGVIGATMKNEDFVDHLFVTNTHNYILIFTDDGKVHWLKTWKIPEAGRTSMGKAIVNLLQLKQGTRISAIIPVQDFTESEWLVMVTRKGIIKKTSLDAYARPRQGGIIAVNLVEGDCLVGVLKTDSTESLLLATRNGIASKFRVKDVRAVGRNAKGVIGIRLRDKDHVVGMVIAKDAKQLLTITENGYGKRTPISEYRLINRGGKGVINIQCTERNGKVVAVKSVEPDDQLMFISRSGIIIRTAAGHISSIGRNTQGVRIMRLGQDDQVVAAARVIGEENGGPDDAGAA